MQPRPARDTLATERRTLGDENLTTMDQMYILANILHQLGHMNEADSLLHEAQVHQAHVYGIDNPKTAGSLYTLGAWTALRGDRDQALDLPRQAVSHGLDTATIQDMAKNGDLKSLRGDPRFQLLVTEAEQRVLGAQKGN